MALFFLKYPPSFYWNGQWLWIKSIILIHTACWNLNCEKVEKFRKSKFYFEFQRNFSCKLLVLRNKWHLQQKFQESVENSKFHFCSLFCVFRPIFSLVCWNYCSVTKAGLFNLQNREVGSVVERWTVGRLLPSSILMSF